ncbi:MAG: ATP synthase F1 subunit delta [Clostridiaceae bacterium]|jgi:F-type H+-transporting ATPase subunit delta|nr:ATP synthase F1 subunit delta [Clostridiaceae bacterium]
MKIRISQSAKNYADALINLDIDSATLLADLNKVAEVLNTSEDLNKILVNPTINFDKKNEILNEIFNGKINEKTIEFLKLLVEKNRILQFKEILESYKQKLNDINDVKEVEITSAIELTDEFKSKIISKLETKLNKKIVPNWTISEDIISGLVIQFDDTSIDTSLKNKIENLSKVIK